MARPASIDSPNFESAWPVWMYVWVWASTPGVTRSRIACRRPASAAAAAARSMSSKLSTAMRPTPTATARTMSASALLLPCSVISSGGTPAARATCSSPAEATSTPRPSAAASCRTARAGQALAAKYSLASGKAPRSSRARRRNVASSKTYSGVPNSAARSQVSHPPISRWAASFTLAVTGRTSFNVWGMGLHLLRRADAEHRQCVGEHLAGGLGQPQPGLGELGIVGDHPAVAVEGMEQGSELPGVGREAVGRPQACGDQDCLGILREHPGERLLRLVHELGQGSILDRPQRDAPLGPGS